MTRIIYRIPYSKSYLEFSLPTQMEVIVAESRQVNPVVEPVKAIQDALTNPVGSAQLRELAQPDDRVCIVFTDSTRSCPDHLLVSALLAELEAAGVKGEKSTFISQKRRSAGSTKLSSRF